MMPPGEGADSETMELTGPPVNTGTMFNNFG